MTEDNVMEFCQWLISEKGIEAGNLSDYINNNEEEVLKLALEFKKPKFKVGGKVEAAAEMFKCGGKAKKVEKAQDGDKISRKEYKEKKQKRGDVKKAAKQNFGFNNAQFQTAYENAKYGFSNQGLSRRDAKLAAQKSLMGNNEYKFSNSLPQIKTDHIIDIDRGLLNRVAEGPKKVFIERVDPVVTNSNYKINTDINWDNIGNDLELHLDPVNYGDKIFDGGQLDEVSVIGAPVQKAQRTSGDNMIDFVKNIRFVTPKINLPNFNVNLQDMPRIESSRSIVPFMGWRRQYQNGGIIKAQDGEKVYNPGEIRADDRTKLGRWWDKVKTGYRNSSFANSGVVEAMKFTPLGILDSVLTGDVGIIDLAGIIPGAKPVTNVANKVSKVNRSPVGRKLNDVLYEMYDAATNADGNMRSSGKMFKGLAEDLRKEAKDIVEKQFGTKFSDFEFDQFLTKKAEAYAKHRSKMPNNTEYRDWLDARDNYFKFAQHHYIKNRQ